MDNRTFGFAAPFEATPKAVDFDRPLDESRDTAIHLRRADEGDFAELWFQLGDCSERRLTRVVREALCYERQVLTCPAAKRGHFARAVGMVLAAGYSRLGSERVDFLRLERRRIQREARGPVEYQADDTRFASHAAI